MRIPTLLVTAATLAFLFTTAAGASAASLRRAKGQAKRAEQRAERGELSRAGKMLRGLGTGKLAGTRRQAIARAAQERIVHSQLLALRGTDGPKAVTAHAELIAFHTALGQPPSPIAAAALARARESWAGRAEEVVGNLPEGEAYEVLAELYFRTDPAMAVHFASRARDLYLAAAADGGDRDLRDRAADVVRRYPAPPAAR